MAGPKNRVETAEIEAAEWHTRLEGPGVSTQTLEAFFAWRQAPANADAYRRVRLAWEGARAAAGDPEIDKALGAAMSRRKRGGRSGRVWIPVVGVAAVGAAFALAIGGLSWLEARNVYSTAVGEQRVVQLADGSSVRLDTASRIRVRFDGDRRLLELHSGQALFNVAHDTSRPFVVQAGETTVTAVGTVFDVDRRAQGARVTLVSGVVDVGSINPGGQKARLQAGYQALVTPAGTVTRAVDVATETSWADGRIVFVDTPLQEAVTEVNRYLTDKVQLDAARLAGVPVNGVFKTGDRDAFVSTASEVFGLQAIRAADGSVRLSERGK